MSDFIGQKFGNYRLTRLLGQGGFADTYLGEQIYLKTEAAIKIVQTQLAQADQEGFYNEGRTIANLKHPSIVRLLDFGVESSRNIPYLVMDYAPNGTLRQRHRRGEPLPAQVVLSYAQQVAAALQYAHERKIIHRDVKPENMLVGPNGEILLSDFGIAVVQNTRQQALQNIAGTMTYMAPEQIHGNPTTASDQYTLAVVIYEWLCGVAPFNGSYAEIAIQHERMTPQPLRERIPTISADTERVVLTALSKDPHQRFGSVKAFATALAQAIGGERISSSQTLPAPPTDSQLFIPTERTPPQQNTPPQHSGYGLPPTPYIAQDTRTAYGTPPYNMQTPPNREDPYAYQAPVPNQPTPTPPSYNPITPTPPSYNPVTPIPPISDTLGPRLTPQFFPPSQQNAYAAQPTQQERPQSSELPPASPIMTQREIAQRERPPQHRLPTTALIALVVILLLTLSVGTFAYAGIYQPYQRHADATATAAAHVTGTAQAHANATSTAKAQVAATQTAMGTIYSQATSGTPVINDPLKSPDNYGWNDYSNSSSQCGFVNGTYHARAQIGYFGPCYASATNFTDFAYQVDMSIISGIGAGLIFRTPPSAASSSYHFYVNADGTYNMYKLTDGSNNNGPTFTPLMSASSPAIHKGLNQTNLLAVVAQGSNFYLYVNKLFVNIIKDTSYGSGEIGVVANSSDKSGTEAAFSNAQVWQL